MKIHLVPFGDGGSAFCKTFSILHNADLYNVRMPRVNENIYPVEDVTKRFLVYPRSRDRYPREYVCNTCYADAAEWEEDGKPERPSG